MSPDDASTRLVVYGSLAPGEANYHLVAHLGGEWLPCTVRGVVEMHAGYKIFTPQPDGPLVEALLLISGALPAAWPALDEFEGDAYQRILVPARVGERVMPANIYARKARTAGEMRS
ncbi:MAG TPA: gamma-glutamylcyclotransferase family protein [Thermoanaerobaculia bacterium]|nr:gamma-glutamylcyclotransferase family protein [Thermoanaerobaculia bacterium]